MSGRVGDLSPKQEEALQEFKRQCSDVLSRPEHDDAMCLRFLRAREFNLDCAVAMYRKNVAHRILHRVDHLPDEWTPNKALRLAFPGSDAPVGIDKKGNSVLILPLQNMMPKYYLMFSRPMEIVKIFHLMLEKSARILRQRSKETGRCVEANTIVIDADGFNALAQLKSAAALNIFKDIVTSYEFLYPETMTKTVFANAPPMFSVFFNALRPFFNAVTLKKFVFFGKDPDTWKPYLLNMIDEDQLPVKYGGIKVGKNGEEDCSDEIVYVKEMNDEYAKELLGMIPEVERVRSVTISRRSFHEEAFLIREAGGGFRVEFECDNNDIGFKVYLRTEAGDTEDLVSYNRYNCSSAALMICIECEASGAYVLHFDNTFSALRSKRVHYNVRIIPAKDFRKDMILFHVPENIL